MSDKPKNIYDISPDHPRFTFEDIYNKALEMAEAKVAAGGTVWPPRSPNAIPCGKRDQKDYDAKNTSRLPTLPMAQSIMERTRQGVCKYLNPAVVEWCTNEMKHVHECELFEMLVTRGPKHGRNCQHCSEFRAEAVDGWYRHLAYFIYPVADNEVWKWNVDELRKRLPLFNGRRIVAVANNLNGGSPPLVPFKQVREYLGKEFEHVIEVSSRDILGEVVAFRPMLEYLREFDGPNDAIFYGHAKGVTKPGHPTTRRWTELMYRANLDQWSTVATYLKNYLACGAFQSWGDEPVGYRPWVYSGTFFWFRAADVFLRPTLKSWRDVSQIYAGVELWPGEVFDFADAACHFYGGKRLDLYNEAVIADAERAYHQRFGVVV